MSKKQRSEFTPVDLRNIYDMEDIDYKNRTIPEEVAPYAKEIFSDLREKEVISPTKPPFTPTRENTSPVLATCPTKETSMRK